MKMGKGISLEELNRKNRPKKAVQPVRHAPQPAAWNSIRELGGILNQFEREHFRPREQKKEPRVNLTPFFIGILGICLLSFFLLVSWEIFQVNRGNFYFWAYVFVVPSMIIIGGASDNNWKILGLIVLIVGWFYWFLNLPFGHI